MWQHFLKKVIHILKTLGFQGFFIVIHIIHIFIHIFFRLKMWIVFRVMHFT